MKHVPSKSMYMNRYDSSRWHSFGEFMEPFGGGDLPGELHDCGKLQTV